MFSRKCIRNSIFVIIVLTSIYQNSVILALCLWIKTVFKFRESECRMRVRPLVELLEPLDGLYIFIDIPILTVSSTGVSKLPYLSSDLRKCASFTITKTKSTFHKKFWELTIVLKRFYSFYLLNSIITIFSCNNSISFSYWKCLTEHPDFHGCTRLFDTYSGWPSSI